MTANKALTEYCLGTAGINARFPPTNWRRPVFQRLWCTPSRTPAQMRPPLRKSVSGQSEIFHSKIWLEMQPALAAWFDNRHTAIFSFCLKPACDSSRPARAPKRGVRVYFLSEWRSGRRSLFRRRPRKCQSRNLFFVTGSLYHRWCHFSSKTRDRSSVENLVRSKNHAQNSSFDLIAFQNR